MRLILAAAMLAATLLATTALAQTTPPPATTSQPPAAAPATSAPAPAHAATRRAGVTREAYIHHAVALEERRAAARFDAMDTNHDGILEQSEIDAWRAAHPVHHRVVPAH